MKVFLEACGLSTPLTLECDDPGLPAASSIRHDHGLPFVIVGRDPSSDFHLNDPLISRRHGYLQVIAGRLYCFDLGSRSQMQWEGAGEPATKGWLDQSQFIWLGGYRLRWKGEITASAEGGQILDPLVPDPIDHADNNPLPDAVLELPIRIGASLSTWSIGSRLSVIGRSDTCQLVLADTSISTYHASLVRTPLGVWVVDLLSREGVWVNGTRVRWAWLDDGDTVRIGRFTFVLRYASMPENISRSDVPLDAGAILTASLADPAGNLSGLPPQLTLTRPLAIESREAARSRALIGPYSSGVSPLSLGTSRPGELPRLNDFGGGPSATRDAHMQYLEMIHSEMILMVRMFMTMHREQVGSIRDELDRVQQLTRELEGLQAKLGESSPKAEPAASARANQSRSETRTQTSRTANREARSPSSPPPSRTESRERPKPPAGKGKEAVAANTASRTTQASHPAESAPGNIDTVTLHTQISARIAELQRERHGYWRKILSAMSVSED
jgi:pSer/pThr/pTyr-binding forkhead associated (FHA) protein